MPRRTPLNLTKIKRRQVIARLTTGKLIPSVQAERELGTIQRLRRQYHAGVLRLAAMDACYLVEKRETRITFTIPDRDLPLFRNDEELLKSIVSRAIQATPLSP